jgi:hypothetical protein
VKKVAAQQSGTTKEAKDAAYAICTATFQKAGMFEPGTANLTAKGKSVMDEGAKVDVAALADYSYVVGAAALGDVDSARHALKYALDSARRAKDTQAIRELSPLLDLSDPELAQVLDAILGAGRRGQKNQEQVEAKSKGGDPAKKLKNAVMGMSGGAIAAVRAVKELKPSLEKTDSGKALAVQLDGEAAQLDQLMARMKALVAKL